MSGNAKSLWKAVSSAKDMNTEDISKMMHQNGIEIYEDELADEFAGYFESKINDLIANANIDEEVFNGRAKIQVQN